VRRPPVLEQSTTALSETYRAHGCRSDRRLISSHALDNRCNPTDCITRVLAVAHPPVLPSATLTAAACRVKSLSRLNGWPTLSPADASPSPSPMHGLGPTWATTPSSWRTLPAYPGRTSGRFVDLLSGGQGRNRTTDTRIFRRIQAGIGVYKSTTCSACHPSNQPIHGTFLAHPI